MKITAFLLVESTPRGEKSWPVRGDTCSRLLRPKALLAAPNEILEQNNALKIIRGGISTHAM